jgi:cytidine deaminase
MAVELTEPDDVKLVTLARANRARAHSLDGAAVRDTDGRTYSASSVDLASLQLSALQVAVAMAVSSGVGGLEAAVVVTETLAISESDASAVRDFAGPGVPIYRANPAGVVLDSVST